MRKIFILIILIISSCTSQKQTKGKSTFGIVIHGGAGTILKKNMTEEMEKMYLRQLEEAVQIGFQIIKNDKSNYYILIYESSINNQSIYNLIGIKNKFLFYLDELSPKFIQNILKIN